MNLASLTNFKVKVWYQDPEPNYYLGIVLSFDKSTGGHNIQFKDGEFVRYLDNERSWYLVDQSMQEKLTKKLGLSVPGQVEEFVDLKQQEPPEKKDLPDKANSNSNSEPPEKSDV